MTPDHMIEDAIVTQDEDVASDLIRRANEELWNQTRAAGREPTRKIIVIDLERYNVPIDSAMTWLTRLGNVDPSVFTK